MKLFALTQPNPIQKKFSTAIGEMGLGEGQGNNHQLKQINIVFKNLNFFKRKKKPAKKTPNPQTHFFALK